MCNTNGIRQESLFFHFSVIPSPPPCRIPADARTSWRMPGHAVRQPSKILFPLMVASISGLPTAPAPEHAPARPRGRWGPHPRCGSGKKRSQDKHVYPATTFCKESQCFSAHLWLPALLLRPPSAPAFSYGLPHGSADADPSAPERPPWPAAHSHSCAANASQCRLSFLKDFWIVPFGPLTCTCMRIRTLHVN